MFSRQGICLRRAKIIFWILAIVAVSWIFQFPVGDDPENQRIFSAVLKKLAKPFAVEAALAAGPLSDAGEDQSLVKNLPLGGMVSLDGSLSNDADGDSLAFEWYGPFIDAAGATPSVEIPQGTYTATLTVQDGTGRSEPDSAVIVMQPCFPIAARAKSGKIQLTWTHIAGTERYDVYRADDSSPFEFAKIAETTSTYSTYLNIPVQNEVTYLYVVGALNQGEWCYSNVISSHPTALRTRGAVNYAPVIYSSPVTHGTAGIVYNYDVNSTDPNNHAPAYGLTAAPAGMTIDAATGLISWVPAQPGAYPVTAVVSDGSGGVDSQSFTIHAAAIPALNRSPVAVPAGPAEGTVGQLLPFNGSASHDPDGDSLNCTWNFGDGGTADGLDVSHSYGAEGTYTVTLTVDDGHGASDTATLEVTISDPNTPPEADVGGPYFGILGQAITFDGSGSSDPDGDNLTYAWSFGDNTTGAGETPTHAYSAAGAYTLTLTVSDGRGGADTAQTQATITAGNRPPSLEDVDNQEISEGQSLSFQLVASDPDNDTLDLYSSDLPSGAAFEPAAAPNVYTFSWTPTYEQSSSEPYTIEFSLTDGELTTFITVQITVLDVNRAPVIGSVPLQNISEMEAVTFQVTGTDPDGDDLTYSADDLPVGASFDAANKSFSWTPTYEHAGSYTIAFTVTDTGNLSDSTDVRIIVANKNRRPALLPVSDRTIAETKTIVFRITGSDPDSDELTYSDHNQPADASFDPATQIFSWTPAGGYAGIYEVEFATSDGFLSDSISVRIIVTAYDVNNSPSLTPVDSQTTDEGQLLAFPVSASDPNGDDLVYLASETPSGAVFEATADPNIFNFSWTPGYDQAGQFTVNLTATDPGGLSDTINVDIVVNNVNRSPLLDTLPDHHISETKLLTIEVTGTDPDDDALSFIADNLPDGASFNPSIRMFSWTPTDEQAGEYDVDFIISDGDLTDSTGVHITVSDFDINNSPSLTPVGDQVIDEGQVLTFQVTGNDPNDDELTYTTGGLPAEASFDGTDDPNVKAFSWTPDFDQSGTYHISFTVTDPGGLADTIDVAITVNNVNRPPSLDPVAGRQVNEGEELTFQLSGGDPDGDSITFDAANLPPGAVLEPASGAFAWTPTFDQSGAYPITFYAGDGTAATQRQASIEVVDVNRPPVILTTALPNARVDQVYQQRIEAEDKDGDPLSFALTIAPTGAGIDAANGQLTWTPSIGDIGDHPLSVQVTETDDSGSLDSRDYILVVPDTIPPNVFISAPATAIPGSLFAADVKAADNIEVSSLAVEAADCDVQQSAALAEQWEVTPGSGLAIGQTITLTATATDSSGNTARATARVEMVGTPDIEPPRIELIAPPVVTPGQNIRLTARVSDNAGVAEVRFFTTGSTDPFAVTGGLNPAASYLITEPAGATIQFTATAVDTSGNTADAFVSSEVVDPADQATPPDVAEPVVDLTAPPSVAEDASLAITVATDESCLAQVDIYVNHTLAASYTAPEEETFDVSLPPGLEPGMNALIEVVVTDCAGNQTTISEDNWVGVTAAGRGVVAGEVYHDRSGLPLAGAAVAFESGDGSMVAAITDEKGRFSLVAKAGSGRMLITRDGFTAVERTGIQITENQGLEMFDAHLTPVQEAEQAVSSVIGGTVETLFSVTIAGFVPVLTNSGLDPANITASEIKCEIPAGAISANRAFALTQISPQGLAGILPGGWSPLAVLDILPRNISFQVPAVLTIPNILGYTDADGIVLAGWDESEHVWRAVGPAAVSADGSTISGHVSHTGQYVFVLPDSAPASPPTAIAGEPLPGVVPDLLPDQLATTISPRPQVIFYRPGVHSDVGLSILPETGPVTSGTPVKIALAENYNFYSGDKIATASYIQDIVLFNYNRPELTAAFAVTPSFEFEALTLMEGVIDVDAYAPTDSQRDLTIVGPAGGSVTIESGESLTLPEGAVSDYVPVALEVLAEEELQFEWPDGLAYVSGVSVDFAAGRLALPALLSTPLPPGFVDQGQLLLVRLEEVQGVSRPVLVGKGQVQGNNIVAAYDFTGDPDVRLPGITAAGRYLFVQTADAVGFVSGTVFDTTISTLEGAVVTTDTLPFVALSQGNGTYVSAAGIGPVSVTALDPIKMNSGTAGSAIPGAGDLIYVDVALVEAPPQVVSFSPVDGQQNVPLGTAVSVGFSEPLDAATVTAANVILTGPAGPVPGTLSLAANNTRVTFRLADPLVTDRTYVFSVMTGVRDLAGYSLEEIFSFSFTTLDTVAPPPPPAGSINASIPGDDGNTTITATQGTAGVHDTVSIINQTQGFSVPVLVDADGSFSASLDAGLLDEVVISITDPAGNETVVPVGVFRNPDGSQVIGPQGGQFMADNGVILDIPAGAFPNGAVVKLTALSEEDIGIDPGPDFPFVAGFEIESSADSETYLNASAPVNMEISPGATGMVAEVLEIYSGPVLSVVDTAKVSNGRLTTSSPPCPGISLEAGSKARYSMFLNYDENLAEQALLSIISPAEKDVVMNPMLELELKLADTYPDEIRFYAKGILHGIGVVSSQDYIGEAFISMRNQVCMPVPANYPLKVVINDANTGEYIKEIPIEPIPVGTSEVITAFTAVDEIPPTVIGFQPVERILDINQRQIQIRFSEPVFIPNPNDPDKKVKIRILTDVDDLEGDLDQPVYVVKSWTLAAGGQLLVFETDRPLPLGKNYLIEIKGLVDRGGNELEDIPIRFSTFKPHLVFPTEDKGLSGVDIAGDLFVNGYDISLDDIPEDLWFVDVDFISKSPQESIDGKWHTYLVALQGGQKGGSQYRLFTIDVSNPLDPDVLGAFKTDSKFFQRRLRLIDDAHIEPREKAYGDPDVWKTRRLYYREDDPAKHICAYEGSSELNQWLERLCQGESCLTKDGGCGDLAVTIVDSNKYSYLWSYDVTGKNDLYWISSRLLSDNGVGYGRSRQYEAPAGMGTPLGLALIRDLNIFHGSPPQINENTVGVYVANKNIGVELVDLGLNIPTINDFERQDEDKYPEAYREALKLNAHLYYKDVTVVRDKVVAIAADYTGGTGVTTLEIFRADLLEKPKVVRLLHAANRLTAVNDFPVYETGEDGKPRWVYYDLAFVTGANGGISVVKIPMDNEDPYLISFIKTPLGIATKDIQIDRIARVAYVGASASLSSWISVLDSKQEVVQGDHLLVVDVSEPFLGSSIDSDSNGWDDRIIAQVPLTVPGYNWPVFLNGFRLDAERKLIYAAIHLGGLQGLAIVTVSPRRIYVEESDPEFPSLDLNPWDYYPELGIKTINVRAVDYGGSPGKGEILAEAASVEPNITLKDGLAQFHLNAQNLRPDSGNGLIQLKFSWVEDAITKPKATTNYVLRIRNNTNTSLKEVRDGESVYVASVHPSQTARTNWSVSPGYDRTPKPRYHELFQNQYFDTVQEMLNQVVGRKVSAWNNGYTILEENGVYNQQTRDALRLYKEEFEVDVNTDLDSRSRIFLKLMKDYNIPEANHNRYFNRIIDRNTLVMEELNANDVLINPDGGTDTGLYELYMHIVIPFINAMMEAAESFRDNAFPTNGMQRWISRGGRLNPPPQNQAPPAYYDDHDGESYCFGCKWNLEDFIGNVSQWQSPQPVHQAYRGNLTDGNAAPGNIGGGGGLKWPGLRQSEYCDWACVPAMCPGPCPNDLQFNIYYWAGIDCSGFVQRVVHVAKNRSLAKPNALPGSTFFQGCLPEITDTGGGWLHAIRARAMFTDNPYFHRISPDPNGAMSTIHRGDLRVSRGHVSIIYSDPIRNTDNYYIIHAYGGGVNEGYHEGLNGAGTPRFGRKVITSSWRNHHSRVFGVSRIMFWQ